MEALTDQPRRIAVVRTMDDLQAILRDVAEMRGMSRLTIDAQGGLTEGYASKLLAPIPTKRMGPETMPKLLKALAVRLVLEDNPKALSEIGDLLHQEGQKFSSASKGSMKLKTLSYVTKVAARMVRRDRRKWALQANLARASKLSPAHRKRIAKIAANARWKKHRKARKEAKEA